MKVKINKLEEKFYLNPQMEQIGNNELPDPSTKQELRILCRLYQIPPSPDQILKELDEFMEPIEQKYVEDAQRLLSVIPDQVTLSAITEAMKSLRTYWASFDMLSKEHLVDYYEQRMGDIADQCHSLLQQLNQKDEDYEASAIKIAGNILKVVDQDSSRTARVATMSDFCRVTAQYLAEEKIAKKSFDTLRTTILRRVKNSAGKICQAGKKRVFYPVTEMISAIHDNIPDIEVEELWTAVLPWASHRSNPYVVKKKLSIEEIERKECLKKLSAVVSRLSCDDIRCIIDIAGKHFFEEAKNMEEALKTYLGNK